MQTIQFIKTISTFDSVQTKVWCKLFSSENSQSKGLRIFRTEWLAPNFSLKGIESSYNLYVTIFFSGTIYCNYQQLRWLSKDEKLRTKI